MQLPHLLSGTIAPTEWLATLREGLLGLDLVPEDTQLLQGMLQVGGPEGPSLLVQDKKQVK